MSPHLASNRWVPLECNPDVFNSWAKQAGLVMSQDCFHDVLGFDEEVRVCVPLDVPMELLPAQLLALVPQPVKALILIFPDLGEVKIKHDTEDELIRSEGGFPVDPTLIWIKQTINNACGTMAILHALSNSNVTLAPHSPLAEFIDQCKDKTPEERAHLLETTPLFTDIHTSTANEGQSIVTDEVMNTQLHYSAFVIAPDSDVRKEASEYGATDAATHSLDDTVEEHRSVKAPAKAIGGTSKSSPGMRLIELDGERVGPLDRGECSNLLVDAARYIKETYVALASTDVRFSMLALAPPS